MGKWRQNRPLRPALRPELPPLRMERNGRFHPPETDRTLFTYFPDTALVSSEQPKKSKRVEVNVWQRVLHRGTVGEAPWTACASAVCAARFPFGENLRSFSHKRPPWQPAMTDAPMTRIRYSIGSSSLQPDCHSPQSRYPDRSQGTVQWSGWTSAGQKLNLAGRSSWCYGCDRAPAAAGQRCSNWTQRGQKTHRAQARSPGLSA